MRSDKTAYSNIVTILMTKCHIIFEHFIYRFAHNPFIRTLYTYDANYDFTLLKLSSRAVRTFAPMT